MTRLFTDGGEIGDLSKIPGINSEGGAPATFSIQSTGSIRSGLYSYNIEGGRYGGAATAYFTFLQKNEIYFKVGWLWGQQDGNFFFSNNDNKIVMLTISGQKVVVYVGNTLVATGTLTINYNAWYLIEVHTKIDTVNGFIQVRIDGLIDIDFSGNTKPGADTTFNRVSFNAGGGPIRFDDIALNDTEGAIDNSWCGEGRIIALKPNANGDSSQFVGSDDNSVDNYLLVDEVPNDGDTSYTESATPDEQDLYNLTPCGLEKVSILRIWTEAVAKDTTTGDGVIKLLTKVASTEHESESISLSMNYSRKEGTIYPLNPDTSMPWTVAQLDTLQIGVKIVN